MKSFIDFSENLDDKRKQLMQKQRVMQQMEKERASRSNQEFQQDREEKQSKINQEKEEEKRLEQMKKEIKKEIKQEMEVDEEFGKMTKKQTQAYTGMDDKEQKALYKKMKKDGNFDVKKNLAGATSDDKDMSEELNKDDKPFIKKLVGKLRGGSKTHAKQADDLEKAMKEESNPRILERKVNLQVLKNTQTYIQMKILKELFMDLVSRTLLLLKHLSQKSGILLDRMLIKFKLLLLWNKGQEKWVKPLKQQSTENSSTQ